MNKENTDFWLSLERERHDQSWKQKPQPYVAPTVAVVEKKETKKQRMVRDQLFFDAGRYKAGARDPIAVAAWDKLSRGKNNG